MGGGAIFNGYFSVDNDTNLVTAFYETINGSTDFNNNIYVNNGYYGEDSLFINNNFSSGGTIINYMNYYSNPDSPNYNSTYAYFNLWYNNNDNYISALLENGDDIEDYLSNFTIVSFSPLACFNEGTKILTDKGYKLIQDLRKGDLVKTLNHDFKPIDMIGKREIYHPALQERIKDQLYTCSQEEIPEVFEPLIITGCHCILVDNFVSEEQKEKVIEVNGKIYVTYKKYRLPACADIRASVYEIPGIYTIYHLALENDDYYMNYGIYANGLLVETCSKRYLKELSNMTLF